MDTKNTEKEKLMPCPVCKEKYWRRAMKQHITNAAKVELYTSMKHMMDHSSRQPYTFSPLIVLRHSPHYKFRRRHIKIKRTFSFDI